MKDFNYYLWLVKTEKGDFFMAASGDWTEAEAAQKVMGVFKQLGLGITGMTPSKRILDKDNDRSGTIIQELEEEKSKRGYQFLAGRKFWEICGRTAEFEAEMVLHEKQMQEAIDGYKRV
jgi:hypothetical protein